jgi:hypothetical protein
MDKYALEIEAKILVRSGPSVSARAYPGLLCSSLDRHPSADPHLSGACLHDHMEEWHHRNPGQEAATSHFLSLAPGPGIVYIPEPLRSSILSPELQRAPKLISAMCAKRRTFIWGTASTGVPYSLPHQR